MVDDLALARLCEEVYSRPWEEIGDVRYRIYPDLAELPIIAFQGTEDLDEALTDAHAWPIRSWDGWFGHWGIVSRIEAALPGIVREVHGPAIFTGHSLGGGDALAAGALWPWRDNIVVAFEPPRMGFHGLRRAHRNNTVRIYQHGNDPVPRIPFWFRHPTRPIQFGEYDLNPLDCHDIAGVIYDLEKLLTSS